ncbi:DUF4142 domain-containing protein [Ciceribacter sp. L1K23]|uniref:DUF4142 domain-containing protein n=1 Tax=Ciceribacter sp. L1K23 TaxID=2820276 RepID=UPI001B818128|nr:DUF4142 domain-containing protein [Ciceribacter sp. L1K23]MBR0557062.1 DUF4142 domain-containing protein [Ciceribacter sp. L1K23]
MHTTLITAIALTFTPAAVLAQTPQPSPATEIPTPPTPADAPQGEAPAPDEFAARAASSNLLEIKTAELALKRSADPFVTDYARQLIADHRKVQSELEAAARAQSVTVDFALDSSQTQKLNALTSASDADFDSAFLSAQMVSHQSAMALVALYADRGAAGPLKAYAQSVYPTLRTHFLKARTGAND